MREVEGLCRGGFRGRGRGGGGGREAGEGGGAGQALGEVRQLQGVGAGGEAEAGAALHGGEAELGSTGPAPLDAASAVAPPLLHRRPNAGPLRAPGGAAAAQVLRAGQGAALALTGGGGGEGGRGLGQAEVLQQATDGAGGTAHVPGPVGGTLVHLRKAVPQALQAGPNRSLLDPTAVNPLAPAAGLCRTFIQG